MNKKIVYSFVIAFLLCLSVINLFSTNNTINTLKPSTTNTILQSDTVNVISSPDLTLDLSDSTNHTLSWLLTNGDSFDYQGAFSFTNDNVGSDPDSWTVTEYPNTSLNVLESLDGHYKVVQMVCNGSDWVNTEMVTNFSAQISGTVEWWFYIVDIEPWYPGASDPTQLVLALMSGGETGDYYGPVLGFDAEGHISYGIGSQPTWYSLGTWTPNTWQHYRIDFNSTSDTFDVYQDGVRIGTNCDYRYSQGPIDYIEVGYEWTESHSVECEAYVDAIDFSWASGYSLHRNYFPQNRGGAPPFDYSSTYSFTNDTTGSDPTSWNITESPNTSLNVIDSLTDHHKVVQMGCNGSDWAGTKMITHFSAQTTGTVEWWFNIVDIEPWYSGASDPTRLVLVLMSGGDTGASYGPVLGFDAEGHISYGIGSQPTWYSLGTWTPNEWQHYRIDFDSASDTFDVYQNGIKIGSGCSYRYSQGPIDRVEVGYEWTESPSVECEAYVDAIDFSWTSGYYLNRNLFPWTLQKNATRDYTATYSFTKDITGEDPASWAITEYPNTSLYTIESLNVHHKVVGLFCNGSDWAGTKMITNFSAQTTGTVEWWFNIVDIEPWYGGASDPTRLVLALMSGGDTGAYYGPVLGFDALGSVSYISGASSWISLGTWTPNEWQHYRIDFNSTSDTFDVYQNGIKIGSGCSYRYSQGPIDRVEVGYEWTESPSVECEAYVDAIDFSWDPGYYLNRNKNYSIAPKSTIYSVFLNDSRITDWQTWTPPFLAEYIVNAKSLGVGAYNFSFIFNDTLGCWHHDDVLVKVTATTDWTVPPNLFFDINVGGNRNGVITFTFKNTGDTTWININFTLNLPSQWSANEFIIKLPILMPGESKDITFYITAPDNFKKGDFIVITIDFNAFIQETGETLSDSITVFITGTEVFSLWIWLVIIIGSVAAVATTSIIFIRRHGAASPITSIKGKSKNLMKLKASLGVDYPGTYTDVSPEIVTRVNALPDLTPAEYTLLLQYLSELDEDEALEFLDELQNTHN
ncbi:MAG: COG1470 family protein [Candidatus Helarchaeota archaeon]